MKQLLILIASIALLGSTIAQASETALVYEWAVQPGQANTYAAAVETLQKSKLAGDRTAQLQLQSVSFDGANPTTHRVVVLYPSLAESETWNTKFNGSKEQTAFQNSINEVATSVSQYMAKPLMSWGEVSNNDTVFDLVRVRVTNPQAIAAGLDSLMKSGDAKGFPGQIWLVEIRRGQASPDGRVTHEIVVGYESMAEMEKWLDYIYQTKAWANWVEIASQHMIVVNRSLFNMLATYNHNYSLEDFD